MVKNAIVAMIVCAVGGMAAPTAAQDSPTAPWRIEARRVLRAPGNHVDEVRGALVVDQARGELRHEDDDGRTTRMPFDAIVAAHYELTTTGAWPVRRRRHFLTVVSTETGRTSIDVLRLSFDDGRTLDALEAEAGVTIDRTPAPHSFLGIALRAAVGDPVVLETVAGEVARGVLGSLSADSLVIHGEHGAPETYAAPQIRRLKLTRSRGADAASGFVRGAGAGAMVGVVGTVVLGTAHGGTDAESVLKGAGAAAVVLGAVGAALSAVVPTRGFRARELLYEAP